MKASPPPHKKSAVSSTNPSIRQQKIANANNSNAWLPPSTRPQAEQIKKNIQELQDLLLKNGKWSPEQKEAVDSHIQEARAYLDACKAAAVQEIPRLKEIRTSLETTYVESYAAISKVLIGQNHTAWSTLLALGQQMESVKARAFCQSRNKLIAMYEDAVQIKPTFDEIFGAISETTNGKYTGAPPKRIFRALEKTVMKPEGHPNLDKADNVCDVIRGMIVYENFGDMLRGIEATRNHVDVVVMRTKDRYSSPTSGGWMDLVVNLSFKSDRNSHVCEIQFIHQGLLAVRKTCGGHHVYNTFRSALELLETHGALEDATEAAATRRASTVDPSAIVAWLTENGVTTTVETLGPVLTKLNVSSVCDLASLNDENLQQVVSVMKKNRQKKWIKNDVPAKLAVYLTDVVATANSKSTVAEWLAALSLGSGSGAAAWLDEEGYDGDLSDVKELEEEERQALIAAADGASDGVRVKRALAALQVDPTAQPGTVAVKAAATEPAASMAGGDTATSTVTVGETVDVTAIASWLEENGVKIKIDLSPLLATLGVTCVLELAELGKEKTEQVVNALKKNTQKKWVASDIPGQLEAYRVAAVAAAKALFELQITTANGQCTVEEWLSALCLSGTGAKEWLDEEGYDEGLEDVVGLEESEVDLLVAAALEKGGGGDAKKVKTAVGRLKEAAAMKAAMVRVPEDCKTLEEAVERVHGDDRLTTIVVGKGEHRIDSDYGLEIVSAMNIVGDLGVPKEEIVVVGGIVFKHPVPGNCHLQHLTLRQAKGSGVCGQSSFTMEDVLVEQCGGYGVVAEGTGVVGRCTNVEVRQCDFSGVYALSGACITLIGAKTTVHHNNTEGDSDEYGLQVYGPSSTIQLVSPLTKEQVSIDNGGGGNWGVRNGGADLNQIKTISPSNTLPKRTTASSTGETKSSSPSSTSTTTTAAATSIRVPEDCTTLKEAVERVHGDDGLTTIVVGKGEHQIDGYYLEIDFPMNIVGDPGVPKSEIVVVGGIWFRERIPGNCHLQHLTVRQAKGNGVWGQSFFTIDDVVVEQCSDYGMYAKGTGVVGRCTDVEVRQCGMSGVGASNGASVTLIGAKTTVHHNCTNGDSDDHGLKVYDASSIIQLVSPLTKEQVSLDNGGGGNWGAEGGADINQIKTISEDKAVRQGGETKGGEREGGGESAMMAVAVRVPEDCTTLQEAVERVYGDDFLTTIVVGKGEHQIDGDYLEIDFPMNIVGDPGVPKSEIVVVGGIKFEKGIPENCHLQHMSLRQAKKRGVHGQSSFTMDDVLVEQCGWNGVVAYGTGGVSRCTNVEVRQCGQSGVVAADGASIILIGAKTTVHHNCTNGDSDEYGLVVDGSSSTIQLVSPLTKEQVSFDNGGGGNWGAPGNSADINQIKTISQ